MYFTHLIASDFPIWYTYTGIPIPLILEKCDFDKRETLKLKV